MIASVWVVWIGISLLLALEVLQKAVSAFAPDRGEELSYRLADLVVTTMFSLFRGVCGLRFIYEKEPPNSLPERFLVVANHQSLLDIPVIMDFFGSCRKVRFVSKKELGRFVPLVSSVLRLQGHALISRKGDAHQVMKALSKFAKDCGRMKVNPVIFPEGTRSKDGNVGTFHSAGVRRILEQGENLPIVALAVEGGWKVRNVWGMIRNLSRGIYRVRVIGIYQAPAGKKDILGILSRARGEISEVVDSWRRGSLAEDAV